jgi:DNA-binding SARP family transcriptional activator
MLRLALLGSFSASVLAEKEEQILQMSSRPACLLSFLALGRGKYFNRWQLLQTLWGDNSESSSLGTINTTLWRLRKNLEQSSVNVEDYIVSNHQGAIGLNGSGEIWLDVEEFDQLINTGLTKPLNQITPADQQNLETALMFYRGDFLSDFRDGWTITKREHYRRTYLNTLGRLMVISALKHDFIASIHYGKAILDLDPLREDVHRELMRYYVLSGQRALALKQFENCRHMLKREMAINPMRETLSLYQRIADSAIIHQDELESRLYSELEHMLNEKVSSAIITTKRGIEAGQPEILDALDSDIDVAERQIYEAIHLIKQANELLYHSLNLIKKEPSE